ncbi:double-strand break repair helicase AddA [Acuticoccus sediminis]|uniref:double-strand break repair helicase AddA n=1 Tax=Acuticoccus sediminis TaxID=2184697 RepID=UPI001CFDBC3B|nr:double-strand break repair helicase AddA [Acuticoccus sediminis]
MSLRVPPEADDAQRRSSDPAASVWVSANAGAGKTYVLSQRVVRLLLSGVPPRTILCLTYTNAAAAEMAQRVYTALAALAALPDDRLAAQVARLAPNADPDAAALRARTLFAEALETPGGLKVQTIHAFAAALLRRFPLEANISGSFQVLDDAMREELTDRAIANVLARGTIDPGGPVGGYIDALLPHVSDFGLVGSLKAVLGERRRLTRWLGMGASDERLAESLSRALAPADPGPPLSDDTCRALAEALRAANAGKGTIERIETALNCAAEERDPHWNAIFLTGTGEPRKIGGIAPKKVLEAWPGLADLVAAEQDRLARAADAGRATAAIAATVPLMQLAWLVEEELTAAKRRRGVIDYDEQIETAMNLVRSGTAAAWVRYKLDEGIDHVMVDEAQDTSPPQWQLVEALTGEFFAGRGAKDVHRTLFVVGDEKQSIYSFQGAAPQLFGEKRAHYQAAASDAGLTFRAVDLAHSMRSAPQVLSAVDRVFADGSLAASVGADPGAVRHVAVKDGPGGVDLWPLFFDEEDDRSEAWDAPFDQAPDNAGVVKLVRAIADTIEAWTGGEGPGGAPPVRPGDIMILSRKRGAFANLMNRELKNRGIPTAGADRLTITDHIAVQDMVALARALLSRDDLSLATVLKSPLFGFSEGALFEVAHGREGSLLDALAEGDMFARVAHTTLMRWRVLARTRRPFDFFSAILVGEGRRADFAARLGSEAEDALDAFLDEAFAFESRDVPTLETFLMRLSKTKAELRRSSDGTVDAVRVMTAHGSKGLEAKVVFLADVGTQATNPSRSPVVPVAAPAPGYDDVLVYAPNKDYQSEPVRAVLSAKSEAEFAEHYRLLYVAMTRAEQHLVVCGAYGKRKPQSGMWHEMVEAALSPDGERAEMPSGEGLAWRNPAPIPAPAPERAEPAAPPPQRPAWLDEPATIDSDTPEPLIPSDGEHLTAVGIPVIERRPLDAVAFGTIMHLLLERDEPVDAMAARVARAHPALPPEETVAIAREAEAVLALPGLAGSARREVDVMGDILVDGVARRASGRIDRLQLSPGRVVIVDYKTDRIVPRRAAEAPEAYRRQLAIYRALVRQMLPGTTVGTAIVWTANATMMEMDGVLPAIGMTTAA